MVMKVRCKHKKVKLVSGETIDYGIVPGKDYLVVGISILRKTETDAFNDPILLQLDSETDMVFFAPLENFTIIDPRPSKLWTIRDLGSGVAIEPELFYTEFFHDRLSDGDFELVEKYREILIILYAE
jgi:hypothetical protein